VRVQFPGMEVHHDHTPVLLLQSPQRPFGIAKRQEANVPAGGRREIHAAWLDGCREVFGERSALGLADMGQTLCALNAVQVLAETACLIALRSAGTSPATTLSPKS
jgi:hypothetical protein